MSVKVSVVIPTYNEETKIKDCLLSLWQQNYKNFEVIIVDDGSTDSTIEKIKSSLVKIKKKTYVLTQKHKGPGSARNYGASHATGEILVFVDADMTFEKGFLRDLIRPILLGKSIGTFSKNEKVKNTNNIWSVCWNINKNLPKERMIPESYPDKAPVYRAILKSEFDKVNGFDTDGSYIDDWSLAKKLKRKSTLAKGATYYHSNPATLREVISQAKWIAKNEFISGTFARKIKSLIFYSYPFSTLIGSAKALINLNVYFLVFKIVYDFTVWTTVITTFFKVQKYK